VRRDQLARHAEVIVAGQDAVDLTTATDALAQRGHRRMLTEGGPMLLAGLVAAGLLDELCLTIGPLMAGPRPSRILGRPRGAAPAAAPGPRAGGPGVPALPVHQERSLTRTARGAWSQLRAARQPRGSRPRSNPAATAAARSLTPSLA